MLRRPTRACCRLFSPLGNRALLPSLPPGSSLGRLQVGISLTSLHRSLEWLMSVLSCRACCDIAGMRSLVVVANLAEDGISAVSADVTVRLGL